ncbi:hypothetical protein REPUB_Repub03eG0023400 [Reevesia pubescens]
MIVQENNRSYSTPCGRNGKSAFSYFLQKYALFPLHWGKVRSAGTPPSPRSLLPTVQRNLSGIGRQPTVSVLHRLIIQNNNGVGNVQYEIRVTRNSHGSILQHGPFSLLQNRPFLVIRCTNYFSQELKQTGVGWKLF